MINFERRLMASPYWKTYMKLKGKIKSWNDDKGFGFVELHTGERAFVHIKAFTSRVRRPVNGDVILYDLLRCHNNRYQADKIQFASAHKKSKSGSVVGTLFILIFCVLLAATVLTGKLPVAVAVIYIFMSFVAFIAYAMDKSAARKGRWRTQERTLHLFSLLGGWSGAWFAQNRLRHKSNKTEFKTFYWVTVIVNISAFFYLLSEGGIRFMSHIILFVAR